MSKSGDLYCPPRSPDLTPPGFFLWNIEDNIREEIAAIPAEMLAKTMENAAWVRRIWATLYIYKNECICLYSLNSKTTHPITAKCWIENP